MNRGQRIRRLGIALPAVIIVGFVGTQLTQAKLSTANYEMADGDLVGTDDWEGLGAKEGVAFPTCGAGTKILCAVDRPSGRNDNSFGNGTKEDTVVPSITTGSIPNNKSDLIRAYMSGEVGSNGDNYLYLAWERVQDPSGSTNMDFELNQSRDLSSNGVTPVRTAGDILVSYDLANGGTVPVLGYREWVTSGSSAAADCEASSAYPCWSKVVPLGSGQREGSINTASVVDPIRIGSQSAPRTLGVRTFGEAALNLTAANILPEDGCITFGSVFLKSRSSDSFSAAVKDFIAPTGVEITNCGKVNIAKTDDEGDPLADIDFQVWSMSDEEGFDPDVDEPLTGASCTTAADGTCTLYNVPFGTYWLVEDAASTPDAYETAEPQSITVDQGNDSGIDVDVVNPRKPGSVTVVKVDDAATPNPVDGATFELYTATREIEFVEADEEATGLSCTTASDADAGTAGECVIEEVEWGTYWLVETDVPDGYHGADPVLVTISADDRDITTDPIVNPALFTTVTFVCDNAGNLVAGSIDYDVAGETTSGSTATLVGDDEESQSIIEAAICGTTSGVVESERGSLTADITIP